jgi:hypothetical protein
MGHVYPFDGVLPKKPGGERPSVSIMTGTGQGSNSILPSESNHRVTEATEKRGRIQMQEQYPP